LSKRLKDIAVTLSSDGDHVRETIDTLGYTITQPADYGLGHYIRNAVVGRLRPIEQGRILLGGEATDPVVTYVTRKLYQYQDRPFVHYNIHLRSFGDPKPWQQQSWSLSPSYWLPFVRMYQDAYRNRAREVEQIVAYSGTELEITAKVAEQLPALVASQFRDRGFRTDDSVFTPGADVWTAAASPPQIHLAPLQPNRCHRRRVSSEGVPSRLASHPSIG
jgi:hypothetical protein